MYRQLEAMNHRPEPFSQYSAADLWTDAHTSERMLAFHLDGEGDISSRKSAFIDRAADWIIDRFRLDAGKRVADFGCGPGLYTERLAPSGAAVTGIDFSERSLRYARDAARRLGLPIEYVHGDYLEYESEKRFDLITLIYCDYCALSPAQRAVMLDKFRRHLRPGGALLLDVFSLSAFHAREEATRFEANLLNGFWSAAPYFGFLNVFKYEDEKVILDKYTIIEKKRTREIYNWLQYFDADTLTGEIEAHGWLVEEVIGNVAGDPYDATSGEFAIIAGRGSS